MELTLSWVTQAFHLAEDPILFVLEGANFGVSRFAV